MIHRQWLLFQAFRKHNYSSVDQPLRDIDKDLDNPQYQSHASKITPPSFSIFTKASASPISAVQIQPVLNSKQKPKLYAQILNSLISVYLNLSFAIYPAYSSSFSLICLFLHKLMMLFFRLRFELRTFSIIIFIISYRLREN